MSFEVCGMIAECDNLAASTHVQEDDVLPPLHTGMGPLLCQGQVMGALVLLRGAQICNFSREFAMLRCPLVEKSWCPASLDENVGWGI